MVKAILENRKSMTRRVVKPQPPEGLRVACIEEDGTHHKEWLYAEDNGDPVDSLIHCPYGQVGDRLWVRESHCVLCHPDFQIVYKADNQQFTGNYKWKSGRFMFKKYARLWLEITNIRVERLQEITEADAKAEGSEFWWLGKDGEKIISDTAAEYSSDNVPQNKRNYIKGFSILWDSISGKTSQWSSNPWVWIIEFKKVL
jgi:hypothetical protein